MSLHCGKLFWHNAVKGWKLNPLIVIAAGISYSIYNLSIQTLEDLTLTILASEKTHEKHTRNTINYLTKNTIPKIYWYTVSHSLKERHYTFEGLLHGKTWVHCKANGLIFTSTGIDRQLQFFFPFLANAAMKKTRWWQHGNCIKLESNGECLCGVINSSAFNAREDTSNFAVHELFELCLYKTQRCLV